MRRSDGSSPARTSSGGKYQRGGSAVSKITTVRSLSARTSPSTLTRTRTRTRHGVDAMVRVAGVCQRLHVLLEPAVHAPPVEGDVGPQVRHQAAIRLVGPPRVPDHPVAEGEVGIAGGPLALRGLRPAVGHQQVGPDALARKVVARKLAMLEEQHGRPAVDDHLVADDAADPAWRRFEVEPALARKRSVRDSPRADGRTARFPSSVTSWPLLSGVDVVVHTIVPRTRSP